MADKLSYCQACLSDKRKLYPLAHLPLLRKIINLWEMNSVGGICWECRSLMMKFQKFKTQVGHAQHLLKNYDQLQDLKCLSSLSIYTNNKIYEFNYKNDPLTNIDSTEMEQHITIKHEIDSENISTDMDIQLEKYHSEFIDEMVENCSFDFDSEEKPVIENNIYVDILNSTMKHEKRLLTKRTKLKPKKKSRTKLKSDSDEEDLKQKFTMVVFTEEEMIRNREEKRNQPNFKKIPFKCDSCVLGFTRKDTYDLHMEKKHDESIGSYECPVCCMRFASSARVEKHRMKHYACYRCRLCRYSTAELWSALSHCRLKHRGDTCDRIHCAHCAAVAKTPEEMSEHMGTQHSIICNECGQKFKGPNTLRLHIRRIHGVKREFICDICTKTFKTKSRLESHMVTHNSSIAQKLAFCSLCKIQYKNIYVYRNHLRTSANHAEHMYQCRECNKRFASKVYWKKHYNFYHLHKSQYQCELCNKLFISEWRLKSHRQTQHGSSRSRDHHCNVCGKQFFTVSTLRGHQLTHSTERSFMCSECGDTFKQRPALYTHHRLVHQRLKRTNKPR